MSIPAQAATLVLDPTTAPPTLICAWCERTIARRGQQVSHGICLECYPRETGVPSVECPANVEPKRLPFGSLVIDSEGTIIEHRCNAICDPCEPGPGCVSVRGRNLFRDVLPLPVLDRVRRWMDHERELRPPFPVHATFEFVLTKGQQRLLIGMDCAWSPITPYVRIDLSGVDDHGASVRVRRQPSS